MVGVRPGGVEADDAVDGAVTPDDAIEALAELGVAGGGRGEGEFGGGGVEIVLEEASVGTVAGGVDPDTAARRRGRRGRGSGWQKGLEVGGRKAGP